VFGSVMVFAIVRPLERRRKAANLIPLKPLMSAAEEAKIFRRINCRGGAYRGDDETKSLQNVKKLQHVKI
jgi:hypothetical protein